MLHFWLMHWLFEKRFYTWFYAFNVTPNRRSQCKSIFNTSSRKLITILEGFIPMWRRIQQKVLKRSAIVTSALLQSSKNHARKIKKGPARNSVTVIARRSVFIPPGKVEGGALIKRTLVASFPTVGDRSLCAVDSRSCTVVHWYSDSGLWAGLPVRPGLPCVVPVIPCRQVARGAALCWQRASRAGRR